MPVFCQLDSTRCHVMVDQLASRYCLVGESMYGSKAVKQLKLAVFAQPFSSSMDSSIRVYVLPDTQDAFSVSTKMLEYQPITPSSMSPVKRSQKCPPYS